MFLRSKPKDDDCSELGADFDQVVFSISPSDINAGAVHTVFREDYNRLANLIPDFEGVPPTVEEAAIEDAIAGNNLVETRSSWGGLSQMFAGLTLLMRGRGRTKLPSLKPQVATNTFK